MKSNRLILGLMLVVLTAPVITGCEKRDKTVGQAIDEAGKDAERGINRAADKIADATD